MRLARHRGPRCRRCSATSGASCAGVDDVDAVEDRHPAFRDAHRRRAAADLERSPVCVGREHERALRALEQIKHRIALDAARAGRSRCGWTRDLRTACVRSSGSPRGRRRPRDGASGDGRTRATRTPSGEMHGLGKKRGVFVVAGGQPRRRRSSQTERAPTGSASFENAQPQCAGRSGRTRCTPSRTRRAPART